MNIQEVKLWSNLDITLTGDKDTVYNARLADYYEDGILVTIPSNKGKQVDITRDSNMHVDCICDNSPMRWEGIFRGVHMYNNSIELYKIECQQSGRVFNRRREFRVKFIQSGTVQLGDIERHITTKDISYSGIGFNSVVELEVDRTVSIKIEHNDEDIELEVKLIRRRKLDSGDFNYGGIIVKSNKNINKILYDLQVNSLRNR